MRKPRPDKSPYFRTNEMMKSLSPNWASAENAILSELVSRMELIRLPDINARVEYSHVGSAYPRQEVGEHLHTQMEIFRVESGQTNFYVGDRHVVYRKGEIAIMPARTIHRWTNGKNASHFLAFMVAAEPACTQRSSLGYHLAEAAAAQDYRARHDESLQRAFDGIRNEIKHGRDDSLQICTGHLNVALTIIFRHLRDAVGFSVPKSSAAIHERYIMAAQSYVRSHLSEELSVQVVADAVGVSPRHLNRMFSRAGLGSIGQCIEKMRIDHAQWLLRQGSYPVKTIAQLCGFRGTPYFSRVFRKVTGRPPSAARRTTNLTVPRIKR